MDKIISDLVEVALFFKDWKIYFHYQVSKLLFLYVCLQLESGGALCDGDFMCLCVVKSILFSGDWFVVGLFFFIKSVRGCCLLELAFCDTVTILYIELLTFFTNAFLLY